MSVKEEGGTGVVEKEKIEHKRPPMYNVVMHNDDFTPMDFVTWTLVQHFNKDLEGAIQLMLKVHQEGKAVAGTYTQEIANTKATRAMDDAKKAGHPFLLNVQPV